MFTKKDYKAIAEILNKAHETSPTDVNEVLDYVRRELTQLFAADNPRFDADRFADACAA